MSEKEKTKQKFPLVKEATIRKIVVDAQAHSTYGKFSNDLVGELLKSLRKSFKFAKKNDIAPEHLHVSFTVVPSLADCALASELGTHRQVTRFGFCYGKFYCDRIPELRTFRGYRHYTEPLLSVCALANVPKKHVLRIATGQKRTAVNLVREGYLEL